MDESETLVEAYLKNIGFTDVRYEPDGNVTPDFLADCRVAVEVRRLNQNFDDGSGKGLRGLEEAAIPLWQWVRDYLTGLGPAPASGCSWYVLYRFSRPTPALKDLKRELDALLKPFMAEADPQPFEGKLNSNFWIKVSRSSLPRSTFFCQRGTLIDSRGAGFWLKWRQISSTASPRKRRRSLPIVQNIRNGGSSFPIILVMASTTLSKACFLTK